MTHTKIEYMYRDASNYKFHGEFVVKGKLRRRQIENFLHEKEFFVPHEVGLDHLLNLPLNQDDHYLHTFEDFQETTDANCICSANEFIEKMRKASSKGWFSSFEFHWQNELKKSGWHNLPPPHSPPPPLY